MANFCGKCGGKLPPGAQFCGQCGAQVLGKGAIVRANAATTPTESRSASPPSAGKTRTMLLVSVALILLAGGGWYFYSGASTEKAELSPHVAATSPKGKEEGSSSSPMQHNPQSGPQPPAQQNHPTNAATNAKTPNQQTLAPVQVLQAFHQNITSKNYRTAYNYLSADFQDAVSYEGWAPGFRTTVSSTVSNVKVESQTDTQAVLTYTLQAVDNPGGTRYFQGTAVLIKTAGGWKIDDITNKTI